MYDEKHPLVIKTLEKSKPFIDKKLNWELIHYTTIEPTSYIKWRQGIISKDLLQMFTCRLHFNYPISFGSIETYDKITINIWLPVEADYE